MRFFTTTAYFLVATTALHAPAALAEDFFDTDAPTDAPTAFYEIYDYDCEGCIDNGFVFCSIDARCNWLADFPFACNADTGEGLVFDAADCSPPDNFFSDPLYTSNEWVYNMINVRPVWEKGYFGNGIRVRMNDDGLDYTHAEFAGRVDLDASCDDVLPGDDLYQQGYSHGMAVASVMGASGNNGECAVGIAPETTISVCKWENFVDEDEHKFLNYKFESFDVSLNSFGIPGCADENKGRRQFEDIGNEECPFLFSDPEFGNPCDFCDFNNITELCASEINAHCSVFVEQGEDVCLEFLEHTLGGTCQFGPNVFSVEEFELAINQTIEEGREGKGIVWVFASGNSYTDGADAGQSWYAQNTRMTISVGSVGQDGLHAPYSTPGATLLISAPGGNELLSENQQSAANIGVGATDICADSGPGTSFAAPIVAGVVALMLEANRELSWRDVQAILASTGQMVDDDTDDSSAVNGVGYWHSNQYGFGIIDAEAAVELSESWNNLGPEEMVTASLSGINIEIPDDVNQPVVTSINLEETNLLVETVQIFVSLDHSSRGHLQLLLTSPSGMVSELLPGIHPENGQEEKWRFTTVRHWGEVSDGDWTLSIVDRKEGDVESCIDDDWTVTVLFPDGTESPIDCKLISFNDLCVNGEVDVLKFEEVGLFSLLDAVSESGSGFLMTEACCECGGGIPSSAFTETLLEWSIEVYGSSAIAPVNPTETPVAPTQTPVEAPDCSSIEDIICSTESLSILCEVLQFTTLPEIRDTGNYTFNVTLFAPSDSAFGEVAVDFQSDTFDANVLLTHITFGVLFKDDLPCESTANILEMVNLDKTRVICLDGVPTHIQGPANAVDAMPAFVETDIEACNGIIHIIDNLILQ